MSCLVGIQQNMCSVKIFQLQSMSNAITYIDEGLLSRIWYMVSGLDIQLEQSENDNPAWKNQFQGCKMRRVIYHCFLVN